MPAARSRTDALDVISLLKAQGLRATSARIALLHSLNELGYATADQLHAAVVSQLSSVSPSTVYRTLESLTEHQLVRHAHLLGAAPSYYLAREPEHAHLVCNRCGTVDNLSGPILQQLIDDLASSAKFVVNTSHLSVEGLCERCQQTTGNPNPAAVGLHSTTTATPASSGSTVSPYPGCRRPGISRRTPSPVTEPGGVS